MNSSSSPRFRIVESVCERVCVGTIPHEFRQLILIFVESSVSFAVPPRRTLSGSGIARIGRIRQFTYTCWSVFVGARKSCRALQFVLLSFQFFSTRAMWINQTIEKQLLCDGFLRRLMVRDVDIAIGWTWQMGPFTQCRATRMRATTKSLGSHFSHFFFMLLLLLFNSPVEVVFSARLVCRRRASAQQMCVRALFCCEAVFKWKNHFSISTNAQQREEAQQWFDRFMQCFKISLSPVLLAAIILNFEFLLSMMGLLYFCGFVSASCALLQTVMVVNQLIGGASNIVASFRDTDRAATSWRHWSEAWLWTQQRQGARRAPLNSVDFHWDARNWRLRPIKSCMMRSSSPE